MGQWIELKKAAEAAKGVDNPFGQDKVESISIFMSRNFMDKSVFDIRGNIEFKNKMTSGKQSFTGGSIQDILQQMESFLKTI